MGDLEFNHWFWVILAIILMSAEVFVPGAFLLWIGLAALVLGGIVFLIPSITIPMQLLIFASLSIAFGVWGRKYAWYKRTGNDHPKLNLRGEQYIGMEVTVTKAIANGKGRVKVGDTEWMALGPDAKVGDAVKVIGVKGTSLIIEKIG